MISTLEHTENTLLYSYYLMTRAAEVNLRHEITEVLDAAVLCGITAIRTWAFCEGDEWNALQPKPGTKNSFGILWKPD